MAAILRRLKEMKARQARDKSKRPKASFKYFENRDCKYFPCHKMDIQDFNCLFCFCPLYFAICPGTPRYKERNKIMFKSCTDCEYPHRPENYKAIMDCLSSLLKDGRNEQGA